MASYAALTPQTLAAGAAVTWQTTIVPGCCNIQHRNGTGTISLRGSGCCCDPNVYHVCAHIVTTATAAAAIQMQLALDGVAIPGTLIALVPATVGDVLSADVCYDIPVDCGCSRLSLIAVTAVPLTTAYISVDKEG